MSILPPTPDPTLERSTAELGLEIGFPVLPPGAGYPNTKTEKCCKITFLGAPAQGGSPWVGPGKCKDRNCMRICNGRWANQLMAGYLDDPGERYAYFIPTPPDTPPAVRTRINQRAQTSRKSGSEIRRFIVPCDEGVYVVAAESLVGDRQAAKLAPPSEDHLLPWDDSVTFLRYALTSGRIPRGAQIFISREWQSRESVKGKHFVVSHENPKVANVALRILETEGWSYKPLDAGVSRWVKAAAGHPTDDLHDAIDRAESFVANPRCGDCGHPVPVGTRSWISREGGPTVALCPNCAGKVGRAA
jgi:hypothetical protein